MTQLNHSLHRAAALLFLTPIFAGLYPLQTLADSPLVLDPNWKPAFTPNLAVPCVLKQAIVSVSPDVGSTDTQVVIRGRVPFQTPSSVTFGALPAAYFSVQSNGSILAASPYNGVPGSTIQVAVTDQGCTFTSDQLYSYPVATMDVTGPLPFSPTSFVDSGWDHGRGRLIRSMVPATLSFVLPPDLHISTSFFDDTLAHPATYQGIDWAVGTYATFRAILQMCDLNGTPSSGEGGCTNWDGNRGTWVDKVDIDNQVNRAGDDTTAFGDMVLPTAQLFNDQNLVRTLRIRLSLQQHDAVVHEKAQRRDARDTAPFNAIITPAAFIQVRAIPYTIVYQPPGNLSTSQFQTTTAYSNTFKLGNSNEQSYATESSSSKQFQFSMTEGFSAANIGVSGTGDFGEKWDQKTKSVDDKTQGATKTIATSLSLARTYALPALQSTVPGNGDTCAAPLPQCQAPGGVYPAPSCMNLTSAPDPIAIQPFWNDRIIFLVHPQFAAWILQAGTSRYTMMSAVPSTASASIAQLAACWHGSPWPGTNACELDYAYNEIINSNGQPVFRGESGSITLTPSEAGSFVRLDPFFDGQSSDVPTNRGLPLFGSGDYGARVCQGPISRQVILQDQITQTNEVTNNNFSSVTVTSVTSSNEALSAGLDAMKLFGIKVSESNTNQNSFEATLKATYLDSTATVETNATQAQVTFNDVDKTTGTSCGPQCHDPLPHLPSVNIYLDRSFGGFMFQDPAAKRKFNFLGPAWLAGRLLSIYVSEALNSHLFADVEPGSPHATAINVLGRTRILRGDISGRFYPQAALSRGDLALALLAALNLNAATPSRASRYYDLQGQPLLFRAAAAVTAHQLMSPRSANEFGPQDNVTRGELADVLSRAFRWPPDRKGPSVQSTKDLARLLERSPAIERVVSAGYMARRDDGQFAPDDLATRAEAAEALFVALSEHVSRHEQDHLPIADADSGQNAAFKLPALTSK